MSKINLSPFLPFNSLCRKHPGPQPGHGQRHHRHCRAGPFLPCCFLNCCISEFTTSYTKFTPVIRHAGLDPASRILPDTRFLLGLNRSQRMTPPLPWAKKLPNHGKMRHSSLLTTGPSRYRNVSGKQPDNRRQRRWEQRSMSRRAWPVPIAGWHPAQHLLSTFCPLISQ